MTKISYIFFILLLSSSTGLGKNKFFDPEAPDAQKKKTLKKYFSPSPGELAKIDFDDFRNKDRIWTEQKGYITVNPPKGTCFNIMISRREGDKYVCKKTKVPFRVRDMDLDGSFVWKVSTSENDFGTDLTWKTSYRIGRVVGSQEEWPGPSKPIFIRECKEEKTSIGKKVHLTLLDNSKWVVRLPEVKVKARIDCDKKYEELVRKSKAKEANNSDLSNIKIRAKSKKKEQKCYSRWQTSYRVSYLMSGEGFTPGAGIPTKSGECRYAYSGYLDDPLSASLECLSVHKYNWVYLPLTCLKDN